MAKKVIRYHKLARAVHNVNIICFIIFIYTGLALISPSLNGLANVIGGFEIIRILHRAAAVIFVVVPLLAAIGSFDGFKRFMREIFTWGEKDTQWILRFPIWFFKPSVEMPNVKTKSKPGQRAVAWILLGGAFWQLVTGLILVYRVSFAKNIVMMATVLHDIGFMVIGVMLLGHIYIGLGFFKPYRGVWRGMFGNGTVDYKLAQKLWPEWTKDEAEVIEE